MADKKCPQCGGLTEPDGTWCSCGWRAQPVGNVLENRKEHYCEFNDYGQSCPQVGFLSQSTNGAGPWYCRTHFARIMGWPVVEAGIVPNRPRSAAVEELTAGLKEPYRSRALARQGRAGE